VAIYEIAANQFRRITETSYSDVGLRERQNLQRLLRSQIDVVSPDTLVIAEEFGQWEDSNRRIDLLGIDKEANLVVIEIKRTEDGGHMELQAIRYAAMISTMTFERASEVYADFLRSIGSTIDARAALLEFLDLEEPDEDRFAQDVRIVLVSAEFSKELTTAVIWLNERGLDIQCMRIKPYDDNGRILADVQQIIPLPEAEDYRVRLKEKQQRERAARSFNPDFTKYDVVIDGKRYERLAKRAAIYTIVRHLIGEGRSPDEIANAVPSRQNSMFRSAPGRMNAEAFIAYHKNEASLGGRTFEPHRFYCENDQLFHHSDRTYAFTNQWGHRCIEAIDQILAAFPSSGMSYEASQPSN
jgi:RecB family endonuclease NucS